MALEQSGFEFAAAENMEMTTEKNFERKAFESCTSEELKEGEDQIRSLEKFLVDETHECSVCATDEKKLFFKYPCNHFICFDCLKDVYQKKNGEENV